MSIRLLIADDHEIVRTGLANLVAGTDIEIVGSTGDGEEVIRLAGSCAPDVVLLDVRLRQVDGLTVLSRLKQERPALPVLLFSGYDNPTYVARSVALGASGYLLKEANRNEIMDAIRAVASGRDAWTREGLRRVTGALATPRLNSDIEVPLTQRESDVLKQMALGLTNKEIAAALHISYETVKEHVQHILRKLGVSDRTQAAVWAVRKGIV